MKILLRILIVFVLLLSIAALVFGIILFEQREHLKARTDLLEQKFVEVSHWVENIRDSSLEARELPKVDIPRPELKKYYSVNELGERLYKTNEISGEIEFITDGPGTMRAALDDLIVKAQEMIQTLDDTRVRLKETRETLEDRNAELRTTKAQLADARQQIIELKDKLLDIQDELAKRELEIDKQKIEIDDLKNTIVQKDDEISKLNDRIRDRERVIVDQKRFIGELRHRIKELEERLGQESPIVQGPGKKGTVIEANPDWNFVVISLEENTTITKDAEMLVQRGGKFVGKIRIVRVKDEERTAVAEILKGWQQMPIQKGDSVVYEIF